MKTTIEPKKTYIASKIYDATDKIAAKLHDKFSEDIIDGSSFEVENISKFIAMELSPIIEELIKIEDDYSEYRERCSFIVDIGAGYDGYDTANAMCMKELVDSLITMAREGLGAGDKKPRYVPLDVETDKLIIMFNNRIHELTEDYWRIHNDWCDRYKAMKIRAEKAEEKLKKIKSESHMNKDYEYFLRILPGILNEHCKEFVVISNETIVAYYDDYATAVHETEKTRRRGTFIVQQCVSPEESGVRIV